MCRKPPTLYDVTRVEHPRRGEGPFWRLSGLDPCSARHRAYWRSLDASTWLPDDSIVDHELEGFRDLVGPEIAPRRIIYDLFTAALFGCQVLRHPVRRDVKIE